MHLLMLYVFSLYLFSTTAIPFTHFHLYYDGIRYALVE